ncbi:hypothetical protein EV130_10619 [Rhizobium azibense]|uniref:Uncharacterized protein n=1 Tax=Rhizobium azibense TaxID=1136135 RepID=A0A4R3QQF3_9HYPH|nr:hypothetical protein EV130_10619 [Rhizobium azibense]
MQSKGLRPLWQGVTELVWSGGNLADDEFDEFIFHGVVASNIEFDLEAVVRSRTDFLTTGQPDDRIYQATRSMAHEPVDQFLGLTITAFSTARQALDVFARGPDACGDSSAIFRRGGFALVSDHQAA